MTNDHKHLTSGPLLAPNSAALPLLQFCYVAANQSS